MKKNIPRLRMFAGPNGSGKSTVKSSFDPDLLGTYINPDELEDEMSNFGFIDLAFYNIKTNIQEVLDFFVESSLLKKANLVEEARNIKVCDDKLIFHEILVNSYFASVTADFLRRKLLEQRRSFTFETVMSSPDKIELLQNAQNLGYRTYLYYVATRDPEINIERIQSRVKMGGHPVPKDKIVSRYKRSLDLLKDAIQFTNRAYFFDNSGHEHIWLAEITDGKKLEIKTDAIPQWFKKAVWDEFITATKNT